MNNRVRIGLALGGGGLAGLAWFLMRWDRATLGALYLRPLALIDVVRLLDYGGSWMVTIPVVALSFAIYWRPGWVWLALRPAAALAGGQLIAETVKYFVHRPRPLTIAQSGDFWGYSFPSDHAMVGLALWFSLAQVVGELWPDGKNLVLTIAALAGALIGWSQVYLGLNWLADVLAGWSFALLMIAALPGPYPPQAGRVRSKK
jgi:undecaprenyl-diphosphatase